jgi:GTPase
MRFVDEVRILVQSGKGGDGVVSFRRERLIPFGGPDGGDGGKGGDVVLIATNRRSSLLELRGHAIWKANNGVNGGKKNCKGASAKRVEIFVPVGTRIYDDKTGEQIIDLVEHEQEWLAAKGGYGGLGNTRFTSSVNQAPRKFTYGKPGEECRFRLELILMADVGLLGYPNAGKSTLISSISAAKPKVADYPFTTLVPSLGVVDMGVSGSFVVADIPGLIEGAAQGVGLGLQFLRHVQRNRLLLHLVSLGEDEDVEPAERYQILRKELAAFDIEIAQKPEIIVLTKIDVANEERHKKVKETIERQLEKEQREIVILTISSATNMGLQDLKNEIFRQLQDIREPEDSGFYLGEPPVITEDFR